MVYLDKFYIKGKQLSYGSGKEIQSINPSNEEAYATLVLGSQEHVDMAVTAAAEAFEEWSRTDLGERISYGEKILAIYHNRLEEMAKAISTEMGAPIDFALAAQAMSGEKNIINFIEAAKNLKLSQPISDDGGRILYQPIGVVGLITPWNWPINQITKKVIAALLAGCTMVLKPSEIAPLSANLFADIMQEAHLPAGVFNMVHGTGPEVGSALSRHPKISMMSFTGSTRAGQEVLRDSAAGLKKVALELGGKGANIIFADADPSAVARGVARCFNNSGQSCNSPTRMLVERSIYQKAIAQAKEAANSVAVGPADQAGNHIGPVVSKAQYQKIQTLIQTGIDEGARLVAGGIGRVAGFDKGYFVRPTVFCDVKPDMQIFRQEIFGPVLSMTPFDSEEEAITLANDTEYGLTNYIQSQDLEKCSRVASQIASGMVEINGNALPKQAFFGGVKHSGLAREGGKWGIMEFLVSKAISK